MVTTRTLDQNMLVLVVVDDDWASATVAHASELASIRNAHARGDSNVGLAFYPVAGIAALPDVIAALKVAASCYAALPQHPDRGHDIAAELAQLRAVIAKGGRGRVMIARLELTHDIRMWQRLLVSGADRWECWRLLVSAYRFERMRELSQGGR